MTSKHIYATNHASSIHSFCQYADIIKYCQHAWNNSCQWKRQTYTHTQTPTHRVTWSDALASSPRPPPFPPPPPHPDWPLLLWQPMTPAQCHTHGGGGGGGTLGARLRESDSYSPLQTYWNSPWVQARRSYVGSRLQISSLTYCYRLCCPSEREQEWVCECHGGFGKWNKENEWMNDWLREPASPHLERQHYRGRGVLPWGLFLTCQVNANTALHTSQNTMATLSLRLWPFAVHVAALSV